MASPTADPTPAPPASARHDLEVIRRGMRTQRSELLARDDEIRRLRKVVANGQERVSAEIARRLAAETALGTSPDEIAALRSQMTALSAHLDAVQEELDALKNTRVLRYTSGLRRLYAAIRRLVGRP